MSLRPTTRVPSGASWAILAVVPSLAIVGIGLFWPYRSDMELLFTENGVVELAQAAVLAVAVCALVVAITRTTGWIAFVSLLYALVAFLSIAREIPRCSSAYYDGGLCFPDDLKGWLYTAVPLIIAAAFLAKPSMRARRMGRAELLALVPRTLWTWPSLLVLLLLGAAELSEVMIRPYTEEALELFAFLYFTAFAGWTALVLPLPATAESRSPRHVANRNG